MIQQAVTGIVLAIAAASAFGAVTVKRKIDGNKASMAKLAGKLGLPLLRGERARPGRGLLKIGPKTYFILDLWKERELNIYHIVKGTGDMQTVAAALDVPVDGSKEFRLSISSAGGFGANSLLQGVTLVLSDNEAFDARIVVKASDADTAKGILTPELCDLILRVWNTCDVRGAVSVREGRVHYEEPGWIQTEAQRRRFIAMAEVCNRLATELSPSATLN
jgi:hypothetical protein